MRVRSVVVAVALATLLLCLPGASGAGRARTAALAERGGGGPQRVSCAPAATARFAPFAAPRAPAGEVRIPLRLRRLEFGDALAELHALALYAEVPSGWPAQVPGSGSFGVGAMYPGPGSLVPAHSVVRFTALGGGPFPSPTVPDQHPRWVIVPDLIGLPWPVAQACATGWWYHITRVAPLSAAGSTHGPGAFVVATQRPAAGTRLPWGGTRITGGGYRPTAVAVTIRTLDQHAALPADADGPLARIATIELRSQRLGRASASSAASSAGVSLALLLDSVPWPLPEQPLQPARCADPLTLVVRLRTGRRIHYGPCRRPTALDRLAGALLEAHLFRHPPGAPGVPFPHPVRAAYLVTAQGARSAWFTPGGSVAQPITYPLRLITRALADVLHGGANGTPIGSRACGSAPLLVLVLPSGRLARYGACAQPAAVERLRGAMQYAATHRAPAVLAWPVKR